MDKIAQIKIAEKIDWKKIGQDLTILRALKDFTKKNAWRLVISGGYGLDLFLNLTTRTHGDIDATVYGHESKDQSVTKMSEFFKGLFPDAEIKINQLPFFYECDVKAEGFGANIYFVETHEDPFTNINKVVKLDGEVIENSNDNFPKPLVGHMGKFEIEIQDQNAHYADILSKSGQNPEDPKYIQDIENLRHITDPVKVEGLRAKFNN